MSSLENKIFIYKSKNEKLKNYQAKMAALNLLKFE